MIELNVSIVGGSVAVVRPFVRQHFPALLGATSNGRYGSGDRKYQRSNSFGLRSREREQIHNKDDSRHVRQMGGNTPTVYTATVKGGATTRMSVSNGAGDGGSEEFIMYNGGGLPESKIVRTLEYTIEEGQTPQSVRECWWIWVRRRGDGVLSTGGRRSELGVNTLVVPLTLYTSLHVLNLSSHRPIISKINEP